MDRALPAWLLLGLCLLAGRCFAEPELGQAEYETAIATRDAFTELMKLGVLPDDGVQSKLTPRETLKKRRELNDLLEKYELELEVSADLGFPPGLFAHAHIDRLKAATDAWIRVSARAKACDQLYKITKTNLLAGSLAFAAYCSRLDPDSPSPTDAEQTAMAMRALLASLQKPDQYSSYYPLQAFDHPQCFDLRMTDIYKQGNAMQDDMALHPLLLTLEDTQAEAYLQLALYEATSDPATARQHLAQAGAKGCVGQAFVGLQAQLNGSVAR
jgi:hypothetical protein